jgi:hypothetical protein
MRDFMRLVPDVMESVAANDPAAGCTVMKEAKDAT